MGEWAYVAAGYGVTAAVLAGYAAALASRARRARRRAEMVARGEPRSAPRTERAR